MVRRARSGDVTTSARALLALGDVGASEIDRAAAARIVAHFFDDVRVLRAAYVEG